MGIITIDGLSGVGKTARAIALSKSIGYKFISVGYIFRSISYSKIFNIEFNKENFKFKWDMMNDTNPFRVFCNDKDITESLHGNSQIDQMCYSISKNEDIESLAMKTLKELVSNESVVVEGRNTSLIFDNAEISYFISCSEIERNKRIHLEMKNKGKLRKERQEVIELSNKRNIADKVLMNPVLSKNNNLVRIDSTLFKPNETLEELLLFRDYKIYKKEVQLSIFIDSVSQNRCIEIVDFLMNLNYKVKNIFFKNNIDLDFFKKEYKNTNLWIISNNICIAEILKDEDLLIYLREDAKLEKDKFDNDFIMPHKFNNSIVIIDKMIKNFDEYKDSVLIEGGRIISIRASIYKRLDNIV